MNTFQIYRNKDDKFMFSFKAQNGEIIVKSQLYTTKQSAINGIQAIRKAAVNPKFFIRKNMNNGRHYFVVKANNGEIIGTSESYISQTGLENGIKSVMMNAPEAAVSH